MSNSGIEDRLAAGEHMPRVHRTGYHDWLAEQSSHLAEQHRNADGMAAQAREAGQP